MHREDLLIEVGVEEMPARFISDAMAQLKEKTANWLNENDIAFETITTYSTPRRLAVFVTEVADKQPDRKEEVRGPAKKIAIDEDGNWTKAAVGFARGQGVTTDDLYEKKVKDKDYVFAKTFIKGERTYDLLQTFSSLLASLTFPNSMRWGSHELRFIRPVRWLLALYGNRVIPLSMAGVHASNVTYGHRFLGKDVTIEEPSAYKDALLEEWVMVDPGERREAIQDQLTALAHEHDWHIPVDEALLEEVNHLLEYPTALYGTFADHFLNLPKEVLMTSMREHQRFFPVENRDGQLLPFFVTFRNGKRDHLQNVVKGNEKVLHARLSDAEFFYEEDKKMPIFDALSRLEQVIFQESVGTMGDKVRRVRQLAGMIANELQTDEDTKTKVDRAAEICKFDLVTYMVDEFPNLQGVMGDIYARFAGEKEDVAKAVNEHYRPRFKGDRLPETVPGAIVALADKLDTIVGSFIAGLVPTGSHDPYGLRRDASGILHILLARKWRLSLTGFVERTLDIYETGGMLDKEARADVCKSLKEFFNIRLKTVMQERGIRHDVIEAALAGDTDDIGGLVAKAELLEEQSGESSFKDVVETLSRVTNIAAKADAHEENVDPALFRDDRENELYEAALKTAKDVEAAAASGDPRKAYEALVSLQEPINRYFEHVMVMAENEHLRANRLRQMKDISEMILSFADFNQLVLPNKSL